MMAQQGKKVLLIGCDPKSDTTSLLFGGRACPTIIETSARKKLAGEPVKIGDVCFKRDGVFAMELGGPKSAAAAADGASFTALSSWKSSASMSGDSTTCCSTSSAMSSARIRAADCARHVPEGHCRGLERSSVLYVANNVCSAVEYFRKLAATSE